MLISESSIIYKSDEILEANLEDSLALMSIEKGSYYGLNPVGKEIWENINEPIQVKNLVDLLLEMFSVDRINCQKDTLEFLNKLQDRDIVKIEKSS